MILLTTFTLFAASLCPEQAMDIGFRVWQNECAATIDGLTSWNKGEEFASLGIGHFIWYPSKQGLYQETFPNLLTFLKSKNVNMPRWLEEAKRCPWKTREEFNRAKGTKKMTELRILLKETLALQAEFLAERLEEALPALETHAPKERKDAILSNYRRIAEKPEGLYVLLDYVNFKGYGIDPKESYCGAGWGLLQVLDGMSTESEPIEEFIRSAKQALTERIKNAPAERNEHQYQAGWFSRLDTYHPALKPKKSKKLS